jgi:hypothetical protein
MRERLITALRSVWRRDDRDASVEDTADIEPGSTRAVVLSERSPPTRHPRRGWLFGASLFAALVALVPALRGHAQTANHARPALSAAPVPDVSRFPLAGPGPAVAAPLRDVPRLVVHGTEEQVLVDVVPFDGRGNPIPSAFDAIARGLAPKSRHVTPIDPLLVELLLSLSLAFDSKPIVLISGHREIGRGTSKKSYHVRGMAADIAIRGVKARDIRQAAVRLGARGVGLYPSYVHVDVRRGDRYRWGGGYGFRRRRR